MKRMMLVLLLFATNTYAGEWESLIENEKWDIYFSPSSLSKDGLDGIELRPYFTLLKFNFFTIPYK